MQKMHIANMDNKELAMEYIIRKATFDDLEELRELYLALSRYSCGRYRWKGDRVRTCYDPGTEKSFVSKASKCRIFTRPLCT